MLCLGHLTLSQLRLKPVQLCQRGSPDVLRDTRITRDCRLGCKEIIHRGDPGNQSRNLLVRVKAGSVNVSFSKASLETHDLLQHCCLLIFRDSWVSLNGRFRSDGFLNGRDITKDLRRGRRRVPCSYSRVVFQSSNAFTMLCQSAEDHFLLLRGSLRVVLD